MCGRSRTLNVSSSTGGESVSTLLDDSIQNPTIKIKRTPYADVRFGQWIVFSRK